MVDSYYLKRFLQTLIVLWVAITVTFILYRLMPYGPVEIMRQQLVQEALQTGGSITEKEMQAINTKVKIYTNINPDKPVHLAYLEYMKQIIVYQDFGRSIRMNEPVFKLLFEKMPWSIFLSVYGFALGTSVSLLIGAVQAHNEGSRFDKFMTTFTVINTGVPYYITAILMILGFGFALGWFPTAGKYDNALTPGFNLPFMLSVLEHGALPIMATFAASFGGALAFRGNCIREKGKEYIRVGRLRGISENKLAIRYVGRNSLLPIYTSIMMGLASLFGSSIIIETIFNYQAVGLLTFNALENRDYPLLMGAFIFFTIITLVGILIADLTYGIIDPRVKGGGERESY